MKNYYTEIISIENIKQAYFEIVTQFEEKSKMNTYSGADGNTVGQYDLFSCDLLKQIQKELIENQPIAPALKIEIPKRNKPGKRPVFVHTIKERIKSQAVYRVVEPIFDTYFSRFLYSYRTTHPHYKAIKTIVRRYKKDLSGNMLIGDISSYSDIINPNILKKQIKKLEFDPQTHKLLYLYVDAQYLEEGVAKSSPFGIITGLPVNVLFNNLYLNEIDKKIGSQVSLYRRIGDDFIVFDSLDVLEKIKIILQEELNDISIPHTHQKIKIQKVSEEFDFLGYRFNEGIISIIPHSVKNIYAYIRSYLRFFPSQSIIHKTKNLKKVLFYKNSFEHYFIQLVKQYNHVNNKKQVKNISDYFFKRITIYFFGTYSPRNCRKALDATKDMKVPSFMKYYIMHHTGQKSKDF